MDMIVEIQVTQLLTWNFARSVTDLRYFRSVSGCDTFHLQQFFEGTIDKFTVKAKKHFL